MADFCNQCARDLGLPKGDMDMSHELSPPDKGMGYQALCESCGPTLIDEKGNCISPHCLEKHGED